MMNDTNWRVKDLGVLSGPLLVFGGVYSNLLSLEKLMALADEAGIPAQNIICTGDVVAYCADPEACVQAIRDWGIHVIAGNVEIQVREGEDECGCNFSDGSRCDLFSRQWYPFVQQQLSADSIAWMKELPDHLRFFYAGMRGYVLHGSYFETAGYVFRSTPWADKLANFQAAQSELILSGHCGLPFQQEQDGHYWLNAGVIGMPANDGTTRVWYLMLHDKDETLHYYHEAYEYDYESSASRMEALGLAAEYAHTLRTGLWDNCEILPEEETAAQGIPLIPQHSWLSESPTWGL